MLKFSKKLTVSMMALTLGFGIVQPLVLPTTQYIAYAQEELSNITAGEKPYQDNDTVQVIVKLKEAAVDPNSLKTPEGRANRETQTKPAREAFLKTLQAKGIEYKKLFEYDLLFNGVSLETTYKQAKEIKALNDVESVDVSVDYEVPTLNADSNESNTPVNYGKAIDSNQLINVQALWDKNIKGQGQLVSIIDSGIDPEHDVLHLTDTSTAKYKSKQELEDAKQKAGITYGKWYSDKLVYAFNYNDWNDDIKEEKEDSHGMHVTGTAVGNPTKPAPNGDYVAGVAPESQLMFMRVFSDKRGKGTSSFIYVKAIEDSVKLGADSINMSLGSSAGSTLEIGQAVSGAIDLARKAGITVVIAAGNSNTFGFGYRAPLASNPDYGLVGDPSIAYDSISVAAMNNSVLNSSVVSVPQLANDATKHNGIAPIRTYQKLFDPTKEYEYVYVNLGKEEDFEQFGENDLKDKVALIQRGEIPFTEKVIRAMLREVAGVVIFNHEVGGEDTMGMILNDLDKEIPIVSLGHSFGKELSEHSGDYKLVFKKELAKIPNDKANTLTDFTSWGMSSDGELKPDVTAPGGSIYSSFNNGTYGTESGTSMASPHVAGAVALVKQVLKQRFSELSPESLQALLKHLVMSTANPHVNTEKGTYTSPRQQGAGIIDVDKAAYGDLYVTGTNDYGSVVLGNIDNQFVLNLVVHNVSNQDKTLHYKTTVNTDDVENGLVTLKPSLLKTVEGQTIVVPANGTTSVQIPIDISEFNEKLSQTFENGTYIEGFVVFSDPQTQDHVISLPYVGFKGHFENLPVLEKPIYAFKESEKPFYFYADPNASEEEKQRDPENHFTALVSKYGKKEVVLGETDTEPEFDDSKIAFSPNGDGKQDAVALKAVVLRNYENMHLAVYKKDDVKREHPVFETGNGQGAKTYYDGGQNVKSTILSETEWNGKDNDDRVLPDGDYQYVVTYRADVSGSEMQETSFNVKIDTKAPMYDGVGGTYDKETRTFKPSRITEDGSGISYEGLTYKNDKNEEIEVEPNDDGSYTLPENVDPSKFTFEIIDYAGNTTSFKLSDKFPSEEKGTIGLSFILDGEAFDLHGVISRHVIKNDKGEIVTDTFTRNGKSVYALPYGTYTVELVLLTDDVKLVGNKVVTVQLTKENPDQVATFEMQEIFRNKFGVLFDKPLPEGARVFAIDANGEKTELPQSKYNPFIFERKLPVGDYTVHIELPEDYAASENDFTFTVEHKSNRKDVSLIVPEYVNIVGTNADDKVAGTVTLTNPVVNTVKLVVEEQTEDTVVTDLTTQFNQQVNPKNQTVTFYDIYLTKNGNKIKVDGNRTVTLSGTYPEGTKVYHQKEDGTFEQLFTKIEGGQLSFETSGFSIFAITQPENKPVVDKSALQETYDQYDKVTTSDAYKYDTKEKQEAYNQAAAKAQSVLKNELATQEEVNEALNQLKAAQTALNGVAPNPKNDEQASEGAAGETSTETSKEKDGLPVVSQPITIAREVTTQYHTDKGLSRYHVSNNTVSTSENAQETQQKQVENKNSLPKTGETNITTVGFIVVFMSGLIYVRKNRKNQEK
ncbi:S8 family serine peptidase [Granulicatella sp. zg-ZJ]|uniref:S8 family serine peptidase n=1 Tax=Granulicatella sp. zg-ZJ TaxID=2678504 RepID=UPI0013D52D2C|nr:S8 family serine peptidase [Granulicatella sp. zg-ZJ]NEW62848.1 S8 family serine peptidase [Granulicatella sp. zg-ZJ]